MPYFVQTAIRLVACDADGDAVDDIVTYDRAYKIDDLSGIVGVFEHSGKSLAMLAEGVEKFDIKSE